MGKQKGDPHRSKNRPSSSSSAASLLQSSKALSIGFGGYLGSSRIEGSDGQDPEFIQGDVDGEVASHLRRLSKKDTTTKVKALKALTELFKERPASELVKLLPNWIFEYKKLVQDINQQVREATHNAMSVIVVSVGRGLAPHLRSMMGAWWVSQFDPEKDVSAAAQQSFQVAFQESSRRLDALVFCANEILMHINALLKLSPQTVADKCTPIEESTKIYEQVISSALLALSTFLDVILIKKGHVLSIDADTLAQKKIAEKLTEVEDLAARLFVNHRFFQDYVKSKSSQIHCASYQTLRAFAQNVPAIFSDRNLETIAGIVLGSFSDKHPLCHTALWDMILLVSKKYPAVWDTSSIQKFVLPRFWAFLRHAAYGSAKVSYPCILPLVSLIPVNSVKSASTFFSELFLSMWIGHKGTNMAEEEECVFLNTIQECFLWIIKNSERYASNECISLETLQNIMINNVLLGLMWKNYVFNEVMVFSQNSNNDCTNSPAKVHDKSADSESNKHEKISSRFSERLKECITEILVTLHLQNIDLAKAFWEPFQNVCLEAVNNEVRDNQEGEFPGYIKRISEFLYYFGKQPFAIDLHKFWLLTHAVRPLVEKLFILVKSTENNDVIQFLARIVSIYGPLSFPVDKTSMSGGYSDADCWNIVTISSFLEDELISWCLDPSSASYAAKIDLLLSFFEDEKLHDRWHSVLSYATKIEETVDGINQINHGKMAVLSTLIEKFRLRFYDVNEMDNYKSSIEWDFSKLDDATFAVSCSLSLSSTSSLLFLRNVLGGFRRKFSQPLISKDTTAKILRILLQRILKILNISDKSWLKHAGSCVLRPEVDILLPDSEDQQSVTLACACAQVICDSVFSLELIDNVELESKIVAALFCLHWAYGFPSKEQQVQREIESEAGVDNHTDECLTSDDEENPMDSDNAFLSANSYVENIQKTTAEISSLFSSQFFRNLRTTIRVHVQNLLVQCVRYEVFEGSSEICQMASTCGIWVSSMVEQLCMDDAETSKVLDLLLSPANFWPSFTSSPSGDASHTTNEGSKHIRVVAFVDKLGSLIGWEKLIAHPILPFVQVTSELESCGKVWLLIELICSWQWPGGRALNTVIPFLVSCVDCNVRENILIAVINSLFASAMAGKCALDFNNTFWMGLNVDMDDISDPYLRALLALLRNVLMNGKSEYAEKIFKMLVIDQGFSEDSLICKRRNILPFILSILTPVMRKQLNSLSEFACEFMEIAVSSSSLSTCAESIRGLEHPLWIVVSCFPVHSAGGFSSLMMASAAITTSKERALLIKLLRKEASDASVAGFVAHVAKQRHEDYAWKKDDKHIHQEILSKLLSATVAYCWKEFEAHDWAVVISHLRTWLEAAICEMDNFMQLVTDSLKTERKEKEVSYASDMIIKLKEETFGFGRSDLSWTAVFLFSLVHAIETSAPVDSSISLKCLELNDWAKAKQRSFNYIIRILFSSGMMEAAVQDFLDGENSSGITASSRESNTYFWNIVSDIILSMSDKEKVEATRNLNVWTVGKDSVKALYALLFSSYPIGEVQHVAYNLLTSSAFKRSAITHENFPLQEQIKDEALASGMEKQSGQVIKLRHELAEVLETVAATILESSLASPLRVRYFLAWAIFLEYLRSVSFSSSLGERLMQYVQDASITSTLLDLVFQHIRLKSEIGSSRRKELSSIWQGEIDRAGEAAKRASAIGSVSFAVEGLWPVNADTILILASSLYGLVLQVLPACVRVWFTGSRDRAGSNLIEMFTTKYCSPKLLDEEFSQIHKSTLPDQSLTIKANQNIGEVIVVYKKEEAGMDMVIKMPKCYPLRAVEIDCTRRLGISETRLRKWMLSMAAFLRNQNGAVAEAIQIWKQNVDREFDGVEECPICYSIIHTANHSLPRLACKTCKHKFHAACLYKWFSTSHKSTCPLCQTPF